MIGEEADPAAMLRQAARVQTRVRRAGRWYPPMMVGFGVVTIGLVAWAPAIRSTWDGVAFAAVAVAWALVILWLKARHDFHPADRVGKWKWTVCWIVLYVAGTSWFGPSYLGDRTGWWALMGIVVALPAFAEAGRAWERR